jgi:hypothetical protein
MVDTASAKAVIVKIAPSALITAAVATTSCIWVHLSSVPVCTAVPFAARANPVECLLPAGASATTPSWQYAPLWHHLARPLLMHCLQLVVSLTSTDRWLLRMALPEERQKLISMISRRL